MKTLFPKLEIYKSDADVTAGDIPGKLIDELGALFKNYGFFVRINVQTGQEQENVEVKENFIQALAKKIFRI